MSSQALLVHEVKSITIEEIKEGKADNRIFKYQDIRIEHDGGVFTLTLFFSEPAPQTN